jgi:hypothetical protein
MSNSSSDAVSRMSHNSHRSFTPMQFGDRPFVLEEGASERTKRE